MRSFPVSRLSTRPHPLTSPAAFGPQLQNVTLRPSGEMAGLSTAGSNSRRPDRLSQDPRGAAARRHGVQGRHGRISRLDSLGTRSRRQSEAPAAHPLGETSPTSIGSPDPVPSAASTRMDMRATQARRRSPRTTRRSPSGDQSMAWTRRTARRNGDEFRPVGVGDHQLSSRPGLLPQERDPSAVPRERGATVDGRSCRDGGDVGPAASVVTMSPDSA